MIKIKLILIIFEILFLVAIVRAEITYKIDIKGQFGIGETISFAYTITSSANQNITYVPHITCPNAPIALLQEKTIQLQAGKPYTNTYTNIKVEDWIEPQTCTAYVQIISPIQQTVSKNFTINTNPSFSFDLNTCKDSSCQQKAKIFYLGEKIYFDYDASVENPSIAATLTYPDKTTKSISLPNSIKASQIGTYTLEATASKEGYKTITKKEQFGVIKEAVSISYSESGAGATSQTGTGGGMPGKTSWIFYLVLGILLVAVIIVILIIIRTMRKKV